MVDEEVPKRESSTGDSGDETQSSSSKVETDMVGGWLQQRNIGIIGDRDLIMAFQALGLHAFAVSSGDEVKLAFENVLEKNFGIVFISSDWISYLSDDIAKLDGFPIVVEIPDIKGATSRSGDFISKIIERAVGVDITKKGE